MQSNTSSNLESYISAIQAEVLLSPGDLLCSVRGILKRRIAPNTLYNWRKELGMLDGPYTQMDALGIALYGRLRGMRVKVAPARAQAAQKMREIEEQNKENHYDINTDV